MTLHLQSRGTRRGGAIPLLGPAPDLRARHLRRGDAGGREHQYQQRAIDQKPGRPGQASLASRGMFGHHSRILTIFVDGGSKPGHDSIKLHLWRLPALLRGMFYKAILVQIGERGGTYYTLSREIVVRVGSSGIAAKARRRERFLELVQARGRLSAAGELDVFREIARGLPVDLTSEGLIRAVGNTRARVYVPAGELPSE